MSARKLRPKEYFDVVPGDEFPKRLGQPHGRNLKWVLADMLLPQETYVLRD